MYFCSGKVSDFDLVYEMMLRARAKLFEEHIYQWDERYPKADMIRSDLENGYTSLIKTDEGRTIGFFTSNSICEDDVHDHIKWIYEDSRWIILHRLCIDPEYQNKGTGQMCLELFEENCKKDGYESIRIDVFSTNAKAIHIYEKFGYTKVGDAVCERGPFFIYEKKIVSG